MKPRKFLEAKGGLRGKAQNSDLPTPKRGGQIVDI